MKTKNIMIILMIISWGFLIFYASSKTSLESNSKSKELIYVTMRKIVTVTNHLKITNVDLENDIYINNIVKSLNLPLRKVAHFTIYFILGILIMILLKNLNINYQKAFIITILICLLYSLTDEYHQTLVEGRTGQLKDCLIDTSGAIIGSAIVLSLKKKNTKRIENS